jgi:integrase
LSAAKVAKAGPGRYGDGAGLYLLVREPKPRPDEDSSEREPLRFWCFRYWAPGPGTTASQMKRRGRLRELGLGPAVGRTAVSLADARKKARSLYDIVRDGRDPIEERKAKRAALLAQTAKAITFKECAASYIDAHRAGWKNGKHAAQWPATLKTYAEPIIGALAVQAVDTGLVLKVLEPIWNVKPETASRLRGRIESVLDWARVRGHREGENPARWKGHLDNLLPARSKVRRVEHHAALPYAEIGTFMAALRAQEGTAARALEFAILTAARTGEVIGARWSEIDTAEKMWTIPGARMKADREHRVPLSPRAIEIITSLADDDPPPDAFLFPSAKRGKPLSNMAMLMLMRRMGRDDLTSHGFRSTFRDWCAERTSYPSEVAEMALAHAVGDKVEAAYRRGDLFDKRRRLAEEWARFCATVPEPVARGKVTSIRPAG